MRRYHGNMKGEQYLGNTNKMEVHDLENENKNCQIDEIIRAEHDRPFNSLSSAHGAGFNDCSWCLG